MKKITVVDFGGQYTHLIARRIRETGIYSEIVYPENFSLDDSGICGIIFSGGPRSVTESKSLSIDLDIRSLNVPLLGICYGHQLIASMCGGKVESLAAPEYGATELVPSGDGALFVNASLHQKVWMSHADSVVELPDEFKTTASTIDTPIAAYEHKTLPVFGLQFHPEVTHSSMGFTLLQNFSDLCSKEKNWDINSYKNYLLDDIRTKSKGKKLLLLLSGGVDSLVAMSACVAAVGNESVYAVHIDTGFMRLNESASVMAFAERAGWKNVILMDASERYFDSLKDVSEPEEKRKIIGALFVEAMHGALKNLEINQDDWMLVQGTIYPDTIESGATKQSSKIKTHHNRVQEIEDLMSEGKVLEPLCELYKDEVRKLGHALGLPADMVNRRPFPGPGLAIRILINNNADAIDDEKEALKEIQDYVFACGLGCKLLPVKSVGVQGDFRTYRHPLVLWNNENKNIDWKYLKDCAAKIINKFPLVNRCVYSAKPLYEDIIVLKASLDREQVMNLQIVDDIIARATNHIDEIWQLPVISLPLCNEEGKQYFVMRPVTSIDAMTADAYVMDEDLYKNILLQTASLAFCGAVLYDITTKPPGTIEWE